MGRGLQVRQFFQLQAHRSEALGREEIEDAPAHGELASLLDQRLTRVAGGDQLSDEGVPIDRLADPQPERAGAYGVARG